MNQDWLTECYEECVDAVTAILYRRGSRQRAVQEAEEAVSWACKKALEHRPKWKSPKHCRNWIVLVACKHATQTWRTERRRGEIHRKIYAEGHARQEAHEPSTRHSLVELVSEAIKRLPEEDRRLIEARFAVGLTLEELVEVIALRNVSEAHRRCREALIRLREILIDQHGPAMASRLAAQPARSPPDPT